MDWLTTVIMTLLRYSEPMLPAGQRAWARALRVEADQVPAGWDRLAWLAGGARFTVREAALNRLGYPAAFAAAVAGTAWTAWSGPPGDSAVVINRVDVITISVILAGLPWIVRRARGPVAGSRQARMIRTAGYAAILILVLVKAAVERVADALPNNLAGSALAWTGEITFLAVMAGYAAVVLACTARRSPAIPAAVAIGAAAGATIGLLVYVLGPLGFPLRFTGWWPAHLYDAAMALGALLALGAPVAAARVAIRRADGSMPARSRVRQGAMAGLCTGAAAALVVADPVDRHDRAAALRRRAAELGGGPYRPVDADRRAGDAGGRLPASATWRGTAPSRPGTSSCSCSARWRAVRWARGQAGQAAAPILLGRGGRTTGRARRTSRLGHRRRPGTGWPACTCGTASRCWMPPHAGGLVSC